MWVFVVCNSEMINGRYVGRSGSYVIELFSRHLSEEAEENHVNLWLHILFTGCTENFIKRQSSP
jgi:hypothetical protein